MRGGRAGGGDEGKQGRGEKEGEKGEKLLEIFLML